MAYRNIVGFESGSLLELFSSSGTVSIQTLNVRTGVYSFRVNPAAATGVGVIRGMAADGQGAELALNAGMPSLVFHLYLATLPGADLAIARVQNSAGTTALSVHLDGFGALKIAGTSTSGVIATLTTGVHYTVEVQLNYSTAVATGRVNGGTQWTCTFNSGTTFDRLQVGVDTSATIDAFYDDIAIKDDDWVEVGQVNILKVNGAGYTNNGWIDVPDAGAGLEWQAIDEVPHDGVTTYIHSNATPRLAGFALDSAATGGLQGGIGTVKVSVMAAESTADTGITDFRAGVRGGTTNSMTTGANFTGAAFGLIAKMVDLNPSDSAVWETADIDSAEVVVEVGAAETATTRVTAAYLMVWSFNPTSQKASSENAGVNVTETNEVTQQYSTSENAALNVTETNSVTTIDDKASSENAGANVTETNSVTTIDDKASSENAGANVTETNSVETLDPIASSENAAVNVTENNTISATLDSSESAAVNVTEAEAIEVQLPSSENTGINVTEANEIAVIPDLTPTRWRVDVHDPSGARVGPGPVTEVLACSYKLELDRIGVFSLDMPAEDPKAALLTQRRELKFFREDEGHVFTGVVERAETTVDTEGRLVLRVSGKSVGDKLHSTSTLRGREFSGATLATVVSTLLSGTGWASGSLDVPATTLLARFDLATILGALVETAKRFKLHLRENVLDKQVDVGAFGTSSGLTFTNIPSVSPLLQENLTLFPVTDVKVLEQSEDLWNTVVPLGGGDGINQLDLKLSNRASPYTIQSAVGPDGRTYYYLVDAASVTAYGTRTRGIVFKDIVPLANSTLGVQSAANVLYDAAVTYLTRQKSPIISYAVSVVGLRHVRNGVPLLRVGEKVRLKYQGVVTDKDGVTRAWRTVNEDLWVMSMQRSSQEAGGDTWQLVVSTVDEHAADNESKIGAVFTQVHSLEVALRPYTYREIHGPERRSIDATHSVTFIVDFDSNVTYLHQAKLSVAVKAVRTNATGASSGGSTTSGAGSSHTHSVSGQTSGAGASHTHSVSGQTSSAGSSHNHSVSAQSATQTGDITLAAWDADTASSSPSTASTGLQSAQPPANHDHSMQSHTHGPSGLINVPGITHTHAVTGTTASAEASHTHTVAATTSGGEATHSHSVAASTSGADTTHTHSVSAHTHSLTFGIFEGSGPTAAANITVTINGVDRTVALGGSFDADFLDKDITAYLQDANGLPLRQRNTVVFTSTELLDLEITVKSIVTAQSAVPV